MSAPIDYTDPTDPEIAALLADAQATDPDITEADVRAMFGGTTTADRKRRIMLLRLKIRLV